MEQFDVLRIDHFRGFEAVWEIDATEETAINGHWQKVPGEALLNQLQQKFPTMPFIAEDLGLITQEVINLKNKFNLPGMSVLQFGFDGQPGNPHSLKNQIDHSIVYTGTHDNDTTLGWFNSLDEYAQSVVYNQLPFKDNISWSSYSICLISPAKWAIIPSKIG